MRSPSAALLWESWSRNRWGIAALLASVLALAGTSLVLQRAGITEPIFPLTVIVCAVGLLYVVSVVLNCEFRDRELRSGFPSRMFTLPIRTTTLVAWSMGRGMAGLLLFWCLMVLLVWEPAGIEPSWWLAALLAVALAWLQAVCWAVPGSPLAKILAACVVLPALKMALELIATETALRFGGATRLDSADFASVRPLIISFFCALFLPPAYAVAVWGVARDRRGIYYGHRWFWRLPTLRAARPLRRRAPFASPGRAQLWLECRGKGLVLPILAAGLLLFLGLVVIPFVGGRELVAAAGILAALLLMAAFFAGYGLGKSSFWTADFRLRETDATRPLSSGALAAAKLQAAAVSALATWLLVALAAPLGLAALGRLDEFTAALQPLLARVAGLPIPAFGIVGLMGLVALTWGQLVAGLSLSLSGRGWVVNAGVAAYLTIATLTWLVARRLAHYPEDVPGALRWLSIGAGTLLAFKLLLAACAIAAAHRRRLWEPGTLMMLVAVWCLGAACLATALEGIRPVFADEIPAGLSAIVALLALPLARLTAAPLAVAWNRHR